MLKKVYKYVIDDPQGTSMNLPANAEILTIGLQYGKINIWAEVPETWEKNERIFCAIATGERFDKSCHRYVGTVQVPSTPLGELVWHIYEVL